MANRSKSDATLIHEILAGDRNGFNSLIERYQQGVFALAWSLVHDFASAEDITQETFITAYRQLSKLRDPALFPAWLKRIAANAARMWLRKNSGGERQGSLNQANVSIKEAGVLREEISRILASLPEKKRQLAILCFIDGDSRKDVARFLGVPEATLRKRLHDTKRLLQRRIVEEAVANMEEHLLPKDFARRCVCACERALETSEKVRREISPMGTKRKTTKKDCGCGCLPKDKAKDKKKSNTNCKK